MTVENILADLAKNGCGYGARIAPLSESDRNRIMAVLQANQIAAVSGKCRDTSLYSITIAGEIDAGELIL